MYSIDFRCLAFRKYQACRSIRQTARIMDVSPSTIHRWVHSSWWSSCRSKKTCRYVRSNQKRRRPSDNIVAAITSILSIEHNQAKTYKEIRLMLLEQYNYKLSLSSVQRYVTKHANFSRKRLSRKLHGKRSDEQQTAFLKRYDDLVSNKTIVVSVDECGFSEKNIPTYGYSPVGVKLYLPITTKGTWTNHSLALAITSDGKYFHKQKVGSMKRVDFSSFIEDLPFPIGSVILMDNCPIHKKVEETFNRKGYHPLFLPPYSPDLQPVEIAFSKIKQGFKSRWPWLTGLEKAIEDSVKTTTSDNIFNYFRHVDSHRQSLV